MENKLSFPCFNRMAGIIFVADFIEPGRDFSGISRLRKLAEEDFTKTVVEICNSNIIYNIEQKRLIHPYTLNLRNSLLRGEHSCLSQAKKQL